MDRTEPVPLGPLLEVVEGGAVQARGRHLIQVVGAALGRCGAGGLLVNQQAAFHDGGGDASDRVVLREERATDQVALCLVHPFPSEPLVGEAGDDFVGGLFGVRGEAGFFSHFSTTAKHTPCCGQVTVVREVLRQSEAGSFFKVFAQVFVGELAKLAVGLGGQAADGATNEQAGEASQGDVGAVPVRVVECGVRLDGCVRHAGCGGCLNGGAELRQLHTTTHGGGGCGHSDVDGVEEHAGETCCETLEARLAEHLLVLCDPLKAAQVGLEVFGADRPAQDFSDLLLVATEGVDAILELGHGRVDVVVEVGDVVVVEGRCEDTERVVVADAGDHEFAEANFACPLLAFHLEGVQGVVRGLARGRLGGAQGRGGRGQRGRRRGVVDSLEGGLNGALLGCL